MKSLFFYLFTLKYKALYITESNIYKLNLSSKLNKFYLAVLAIISVLCIFFFANLNELSFIIELIHWIPFFDKIGHFTIFFTLTNAVICLNNDKIPLKFIFLSLFSIGILDELIQIVVPSRTSDIFDLVADFSGIIIAYISLKINQHYFNY